MLVLIAKNYVEYLSIMGLIAFISAIGFFYIYAAGVRQTGAEVFDDKIWWNDLRSKETHKINFITNLLR